MAKMPTLKTLKADLEHYKDKWLSANALMSRMDLASRLGKTFGGARDVYDVLGYKQDPQVKDYAARYLRQDIAQRIINALPDAVWTRIPSVTDDSEKEEQTEFEAAFAKLAQRTKLFHYLNRLDRLAGIGHYAVMLIGMRNGRDLRTPASKLRDLDDILYLTPFSESNAVIHRYDENPSSERYGLPEEYILETGGYTAQGSNQMPQKKIKVHHSRLLHIAEGNLDNDVFGVPRLQSVYNRLDDLEKVVGGCAEIFWINGRGGLSLNLDKEAQLSDPESLQKHAEEYTHQLSRILQTKGMTVETLDLAVADPSPHVSVIIDLIAGATGIPKRILIGSERGELSSAQDENNWQARVEERRDHYCEPMILRPFIKRMQELGVLPEQEDYEVEWPDLVSAPETDKAEIASKYATAISTYVNGNGCSLIVPPKQFVEKVLQMEYRESDIESEFQNELEELHEEQEIEQKLAKAGDPAPQNPGKVQAKKQAGGKPKNATKKASAKVKV